MASDPVTTSTGSSSSAPSSSVMPDVVMSEVLGSADATSDRSVSPLIPERVTRRLLAFGWYGGKFSHLSWLLPLLPSDAQTFVEPFGGSAAVLLNREPSPVEVYNDLDGEAVNFFRVLRAVPDELVRLVELTPFSREEFALALQPVGDDVSDVERARRFYVRARQARTGLAQTATLGRWANCRGNSRRNMAASVSRWVGGSAGLVDVADRLRQVQIENRPALDVVRAYDSPGTLFYVDPPYLHETRVDLKSYRYEMSSDDHRLLASALTRVQGRVVLSGYDHPLMSQLYPGWWRVTAPPKTAHAAKAVRVEAVWSNFEPSGSGPHGTVEVVRLP